MECHVSRYERDFEAAGDAPPGAVPDDQRAAIACFLSAGEGWSDAVKALRGAFASGAVITPLASKDGRQASAGAQHKREINHRTSEYLQCPGLKSSETDND